MAIENLSKDIKEIVLTEEAIATAVKGIGAAITADYAGKAPLLITVVRGGVIFISDLIRQIDLPVSVDFMAISAYGRKSSSGVVQVLKDLDELITDKDVILVEDIVDTGLTVNYLRQLLQARRPASLRVCALIDKSIRRIAAVPITYKGFELPDIFVVGYGLDLGQKYRNLPFIGVLKDDISSRYWQSFQEI